MADPPGERSLLGEQAFPFAVSLTFHLLLLVVMGLLQLPERPLPKALLLDALPKETPQFEIPEQFVAADIPQETPGALSLDGAGLLLSRAPELSEISVVANPLEYLESPRGELQIEHVLERPLGRHFDQNLRVKGAATEGLNAAEGAIDRLTQEILNSLNERKTLVVWLLDQSPSLAKQHREIRDRLARVYEELGIIEAADNPAFRRHDSKPLLTSVYWFGEQVTRVLKKPTDQVEEILKAVENVPMDESGIERVFSAVYLAAREAAEFRQPNPRTGEPERNVLLIVFTDEAGEDLDGLETTVRFCRRYGIVVHVVGAPAPFGRKETYLKFVDPDPRYDQSVRWGVVDQGPESLMPERLKLTFGVAPEDEEPIDSGFGPYGLTRLCYETGGIYFAVHPNRRVDRSVGRGETEVFAAHLKRFFDPEVMRFYRPDYVSVEEYQRRLEANKARAALVTAAQMSWVQEPPMPKLRFVKRDDAQFVAELTEAQKVAALLEPRLQQLYEVLKAGEADRDQEASPRWQAGYDLAMGRVLAARARTESYNAVLARAKRGMPFRDPKNNTWELEPCDDLSEVGSQLENLAKRARFYLERVLKEHPGTPWAYLAQKELDMPMGWKWKESFTDLSPPPPSRPAPNNNNRPATPRDDRPRQLEPPKPVRQFQKL
ncbi:MAG: hypothetical protein KatS3mg109_1472 [Pirellulaceae bacterium]|nr:MAG: hypothetical protein KatS3mg109_1472 [Pirellulaceae bacterium]GIW93788.1 MAG: hypothetical protein KatS3mg110_1829 [Pirellulaceae bacterium]